MVALTLAVVLLAGLSWSGCITYNGISRDGKDIYLVGSTSYLIFGENWVRKCEERLLPDKRTGLRCYEMPVEEMVQVLTKQDPSDRGVVSTLIANWPKECFTLEELQRRTTDIRIVLDIEPNGDVTRVRIKNEDLKGVAAGECLRLSIGRAKFLGSPAGRQGVVFTASPDVLINRNLYDGQED